eukprot:895251-Amphidinium_carterae.1
MKALYYEARILGGVVCIFVEGLNRFCEHEFVALKLRTQIAGVSFRIGPMIGSRRYPGMSNAARLQEHTGECSYPNLF